MTSRKTIFSIEDGADEEAQMAGRLRGLTLRGSDNKWLAQTLSHLTDEDMTNPPSPQWPTFYHVNGDTVFPICLRPSHMLTDDQLRYI